VASALALQQQVLLLEQEQWQWQADALDPSIAVHWQFGAKWPEELRQPDTERPLIAAMGTIAQITTDLKLWRIERCNTLPIMQFTEQGVLGRRILRSQRLDVKASRKLHGPPKNLTFFSKAKNAADSPSLYTSVESLWPH